MRGDDYMLTDKQEKFCVNVATGMTLIDAYKNSYNTENMVDNSIYCESSKLMDNPKIIQRVDELRKEARTDKIMTAAQRKEFLTNMIMNDIEANRTDKLKALDILNKMDGEYIEKIKAEVDITNMVVDIEDE
jgi:phage terminase small subunit